jgi:thiol-disulfide isomerase/thioredoxin
MKRTRTWPVLALLALLLLAGGIAEAAGPKPAIISLARLRTIMKKHHGRPLVVHVWASWCAPCVEEMPLVAELARDARARGVEVYSVSIDAPKAAGQVAWVLDRKGGAGITPTILRMDDQDAVIAHLDPRWEGEIPAFFAYDRTGKLRRTHTGAMTREKFQVLVGDLAGRAIKK